MKHKFMNDKGKPVVYTEPGLQAASKIKGLMGKLEYVGSAPDFDPKGEPVDLKGKPAKLENLRTRFQSAGLDVDVKKDEPKKGTKPKARIPGDDEEKKVVEENETPPPPVE